MSFTRILAASKYLPETRVTNQDLIDRYGFPQPLDWFEPTGIEQRHFATDTESTVSMAVAAIERIGEQLTAGHRSVDLMILVTSNCDIPVPGGAAVVAQRTGFHPSLTFDLDASCTGFAAALDVANQYIRNGARRVLIVASEIASRFLHFGADEDHHELAGIFGDGAGAVYLEAHDEPGIIGSARGALTEHWEDVVSYRHPSEANGSPVGVLLYKGADGIARAFATLPREVAQRALSEAGLEMDDMRWLVTHQPRLDMVRALGHQLGVAPERHYVNLTRYGNTSSASIPICLADLIESGRLRRGDRMLMVGMGGGFLACAHAIQF